MKITLIKNLNGFLVPAYDSDKELLKKIKVGTAVQVSITKPRNILFHKKFFALLNLAYENYTGSADFEFFRKEVIKRAGYYEENINFKGITEYTAKSISFAKMEEYEFMELYNKTIDVILKYVLKGNTKEEIIENVINFM